MKYTIQQTHERVFHFSLLVCTVTSKSSGPRINALCPEERVVETPNSRTENPTATNVRGCFSIENTYIFLFVHGNGGNIASKAAVTASVDLLVKEASGVEAHSLISFLHQGSLLPLDLEDLGLDIYKDI